MNFVKNNYRKIIITVFLLAVAFFTVSKNFDDYGKKYTDEGFERSITAFAIAKGLNGAISMVQGTEVALEPAGIGIILTPGQILDPINDLIERFSWIMLLCTISLGIQSILLNIFSSFYFSTAVTISLLPMILLVWRDFEISIDLKNVIYRIAAFLVILRFFIPAMAIGSEGLYQAFLETKYVESKQQLENADNTISMLSSDSVKVVTRNKGASWYESLKSKVNAAIDSFNVTERVEKLKKEAENLTSHIIDLIVVFVMQTILFPFVFIWLAMKLLRETFTFNFSK